MSTLSRREFFGAAPAALVPAVTQIVKPEKAYVIMGQSYDYNDEYHYADGQYLADSRVYYDKDEALARAKVLNDAFCGDRDAPGGPEGWEIDFNDLDTSNWADFDFNLTGTYTWNDVIQKGGFQEPYQVVELTDLKLLPYPDPAKDQVIAEAQWNGNQISVPDYMAKVN